VARVFRGDASVNKALRLVLQLMQVAQGPAARPAPAWRSEGGSDGGRRDEKRSDTRADKRADGRAESSAEINERRPRGERADAAEAAEAAGDDTGPLDAPRFAEDDGDADQEE